MRSVVQAGLTWEHLTKWRPLGQVIRQKQIVSEFLRDENVIILLLEGQVS